MSKAIDRIMKISDDGYVSGFNDIKEILENFLNINCNKNVQKFTKN